MAEAFLTLADLAKVNDQNNLDPGISDLLDDAPLLKVLAAEPTDGDTHKYLKQTGAPTVGFRDVNVGRETSKSADAEVTVTLKLLDGSFAVDKAVADQNHDGPESYIAREASRHLRAAFFKAEQVFINGTSIDAAGFTGLKDDDQLNEISDTMVVDAGGIAGSGNVHSSVWAIRTGNDMRDAMLITGMDGNIEIGDTVVQAIEDVANGGHFTGYYTTILAWLGMQIGGAFSVGRLTNVDDGSNSATLTDDLISELLSLFPAGRKPNYLTMSRRSLKQLQQSRTATNATGAPAPFPSESFGVPIVVTDAIPDNDAATT